MPGSETGVDAVGHIEITPKAYKMQGENSVEIVKKLTKCRTNTVCVAGKSPWKEEWPRGELHLPCGWEDAGRTHPPVFRLCTACVVIE